VKEILNIDNITVEEKCLGLPMPEGQMKKEKFMAMKERLTKGFANWAEKYILAGGKGSIDQIGCSGYPGQHTLWGSLNYRQLYVRR
jgi:hypothetical protein